MSEINKMRITTKDRTQSRERISIKKEGYNTKVPLTPEEPIIKKWLSLLPLLFQLTYQALDPTFQYITQTAYGVSGANRITHYNSGSSFMVHTSFHPYPDVQRVIVDGESWAVDSNMSPNYKMYSVSGGSMSLQRSNTANNPVYHLGAIYEAGSIAYYASCQTDRRVAKYTFFLPTPPEGEDQVYPDISGSVTDCFDSVIHVGSSSSLYMIAANHYDGQLFSVRRVTDEDGTPSIEVADLENFVLEDFSEICFLKAADPSGYNLYIMNTHGGVDYLPNSIASETTVSPTYFYPSSHSVSPDDSDPDDTESIPRNPIYNFAIQGSSSSYALMSFQRGQYSVYYISTSFSVYKYGNSIYGNIKPYYDSITAVPSTTQFIVLFDNGNLEWTDVTLPSSSVEFTTVNFLNESPYNEYQPGTKKHLYYFNRGQPALFVLDTSYISSYKMLPCGNNPHCLACHTEHDLDTCKQCDEEDMCILECHDTCVENFCRFEKDKDDCYKCNPGYGRVQNFPSPCHECNEECTTCTIAGDRSKCTSCSQDYFLEELETEDGASVGTCEPICHGSCASCFIPRDPAKCTSCAVADYEVENGLPEGPCVRICDPSCRQCSDPKDPAKCTQCYFQFELQVLDPTNSPGVGTCDPVCHETCTTCNIPLNKNLCTGCPSEYSIPDGQTEGPCLPNCDPACVTCSEPNDHTKCTSCSDEEEIVGGAQEGECGTRCHYSCAQQQCAEANNRFKCTTCLDGYSSTEIVPNGFGRCSPICAQNCTLCLVPYDEMKCVLCDENFKLVNEQGEEVTNEGTCAPICDESCTDCWIPQDSTKCTQCPPGYSMVKENEAEEHGSCEIVCGDKCATCDRPFDNTKCRSCPQDYEFSGILGVTEGSCLPICDESCASCDVPRNPNKCLFCPNGFERQDPEAVDGSSCIETVVGGGEEEEEFPEEDEEPQEPEAIEEEEQWCSKEWQIAIGERCIDCRETPEECNEVLRYIQKETTITTLDQDFIIQFNRDLKQILADDDFENFPYDDFFTITYSTQIESLEPEEGEEIQIKEKKPIQIKAYSYVEYGIRVTFESREFLREARSILITNKKSEEIDDIFERNNIYRKDELLLLTIRIKLPSEAEKRVSATTEATAQAVEKAKVSETMATAAVVASTISSVTASASSAMAASGAAAAGAGAGGAMGAGAGGGGGGGFSMGKQFGSNVDFFRHFALMEVIYNLQKINVRLTPKLKALFELAKVFKLPALETEGSIRIFKGVEDHKYNRKGSREKIITTRSETITLYDTALITVPAFVFFATLFYGLSFIVNRKGLIYKIVASGKNTLLGMLFMKYQMIAMVQHETEYLVGDRTLPMKISYILSIVLIVFLSIEHLIAYEILSKRRTEEDFKNLDPNELKMIMDFTQEFTREAQLAGCKVIFFNRMKYFAIQTAIVYFQTMGSLQALICAGIQISYLVYFNRTIGKSKVFLIKSNYWKILSEEWALTIALCSIAITSALENTELADSPLFGILDWIAFWVLLLTMIFQMFCLVMTILAKVIMGVRDFFKTKREAKEKEERQKLNLVIDEFGEKEEESESKDKDKEKKKSKKDSGKKETDGSDQKDKLEVSNLDDEEKKEEVRVKTGMGGKVKFSKILKKDGRKIQVEESKEEVKKAESKEEISIDSSSDNSDDDSEDKMEEIKSNNDSKSGEESSNSDSNSQSSSSSEEMEEKSQKDEAKNNLNPDNKDNDKQNEDRSDSDGDSSSDSSGEEDSYDKSSSED